MPQERYLKSQILQDLENKMVFIGGPRQVGKTTFSREIIAKNFKKSTYLNWDATQDRKIILDATWPADTNLLILDEIHKYKQWKTKLKGDYDKHLHAYKFLITGSARLDLYRKGGDSLQGRYHYYRLHPFSIAELTDTLATPTFTPLSALPISESASPHILDTLLKFGGFPEPFHKQEERHLRRWQNERIERLLREDIRDLEPIRDITQMQLLADFLPRLVSAPLSLNNLREDLDVSHKTISHWMTILESFYYHFRVYPFTSQHFRSLKKTPKLYLWDWSPIENEGAKFENLIASHLLKWVHYLKDYEGYKAELHYLKDTEKREVDFLISLNKKPWFACEVKLTDQAPSSALRYFQKKLDIPYLFQVIKTEGIDYFNQDIRLISASKFLNTFI